MMQSEEINMSKYAFMISEIKRSMGEHNSCITHIHPIDNMSSHFMANFDRLQGQTAIWLGL